MATAPWTTSLIRVPCSLRMPRLLRSNPPSTLCPASFSTSASRPIYPTSCGVLRQFFHRKAERFERELDGNETAQRRSHAEQDGLEIRSVEPERVIAQGLVLVERRNAFEFFGDHLAEHYATETGSSWRPRSRSQVNHGSLTAAMIDSRDFVNAKKLADT